jgi:hypothetical protein
MTQRPAPPVSVRRVGIVGGGQLARMMAEAAPELGLMPHKSLVISTIWIACGNWQVRLMW